MSALVLAVPDGAAEPVGEAPTSLELAATPRLDRLAAGGRRYRVRTIPDGLPAGTEIGLPTLLGVALHATPARGRLEAAAAGVAVGSEEGAWRLDVVAGRAPAPLTNAEVRRLGEVVGELGGRVTRLGGHRLLLVGPAWWGDAPPGPHQTQRPLRALAIGPFGAVAKAAKGALRGGGGGRVAWPWGALGETSWPDLPDRLRRPVVVVATTGAAVGLARLLRCDVTAQVPDPLPPGGLVVVHDPGPDTAAHERDRAAKVAAIERFDALVGDLAGLGAVLAVAPDHGCDPRTGRHDGVPVPALVGTPAAGVPGDPRGRPPPGGGPPPGARLTERGVAAQELLDTPGALLALASRAAGPAGEVAP